MSQSLYQMYYIDNIKVCDIVNILVCTRSEHSKIHGKQW